MYSLSARLTALIHGLRDYNSARMGKLHDSISPDLATWITQQHVFFVATAPLSADGHVNCSPKGLDSFRVLGPRSVAYLDLTGSGIETIAHLRENRRIVVMLCAFNRPPRILRLHGSGTVLTPVDAGFNELRSTFPAMPGVRAVIQIELDRISESCGFGVPLFESAEHRDTLVRYHQGKDEASAAEYRRKKNAQSIDGLAGY